MDNEKIKLLTYNEILQELSKSQSDKHLLLGNGFNNSLGIETDYSDIFNRMKEVYSGYKNIQEYIEKEHFDIEKMIGHLKEKIKSDEKNFLPNYIESKVKFDFMNATNSIVQESVKNVYQNNNQGIHLLLKNFTNYFTLNYDPFLYLLLLKFKKDEDGSGTALAIKKTSLFQKNHLNETQNNIYSEIQQARENGSAEVYFGENNSKIDFKNTTKANFQAITKEYSKKEGKDWKAKDIKRVCDQIWKEENSQPELEVNDGFQGDLFNKDNQKQNLYFLHGAFQIIENQITIKKITAKQNKSFVQNLEEAIHSEDENIVCVLKSESQEKKKQIEESPYLKKCFEYLSKIDGVLVILGCSLSENDKHIFDQINKSSVSKIYLSSCKEKCDAYFKRAKGLFKDKEVALFDRRTISYSEKSEK